MEVSILLCCRGMSSIPGHPSNSITRCSSANNSKSIQIASWWSVMHCCVSFVFLRLLYSSGPCYLHSHLTSSDVFTWEMCNTTPWFTERDNLCFRQGDAATARGVGFPSAIYRAWEISPAVSMAAEPQLYIHRLICWQLTASSSTVHTQAFSTSFSFFLSSLSLTPGFVLAFLTPYLIPSVSIPAFTLHLLFPLPRYLFLCQGANVGLQMKQLDYHLRLPEINMCCSVSGRTLSASPTLSQGRTGRQTKRPQLLTRNHGTQAAMIQLFISHIYYTAWAANNNKCTSWSDTMPWLGPCLLKLTGLWNKSRVCLQRGR